MEQTNEANEQPWSEEDLKWLSKVTPEALQIVARRHGRPLFALTWQVGMLNEALGRMVVSAQGIAKWGMKKQVQGILAATQVLQQVTNQMVAEMLHHRGLKSEDIAECKGDIERCMALTQGAKQEGDRVSKGGIILDS